MFAKLDGVLRRRSGTGRGVLGANRDGEQDADERGEPDSSIHAAQNARNRVFFKVFSAKVFFPDGNIILD